MKAQSRPCRRTCRRFRRLHGDPAAMRLLSMRLTRMAVFAIWPDLEFPSVDYRGLVARRSKLCICSPA